MSEVTFNVKGNGVGRIRLEPTDILGSGGHANPQLVMGLKVQLLPAGDKSYTLLRVSGKVYVGNENHPLASAEHPPISEDSSPNPYDRLVNLNIPLTLAQIKHIEDVRNGNNLVLRITLSGLLCIKANNEFEKLQDMTLQVAIPRSHWIDTALKQWGVSDLRVLEVKFPGDSRKEMDTARTRLENAEALYRVGDYPHVLAELRSAFDAMAECYSAKGPDKSTWQKMLIHSHNGVREKLLDSFAAFRQFLHLGPHEPLPTAQAPTVISRQDARFALVVAHAIFEYFSAENWPGI